MQGDDLLVDYTGSSPASRRGINVVMNYTEAYTTYGVKVIVSPDVPNNEGAFRVHPHHRARGLHPERAPPGPGGGPSHRRPLPAPRVAGALGQALPDRVMAEGSANIWGLQVTGKDLDRTPWSTLFFSSGGTGARPQQDGLSATAFPSGVLGTPVEVIENLSPLLVERKASVTTRAARGSTAAASARSSRSGSAPTSPPPARSSAIAPQTPAHGFLGGRPGVTGQVLINGRAPANPKAEQTLRPGALVEILLPGGGGYGDPAERDPALRARDLQQGYVLPAERGIAAG